MKSLSMLVAGTVFVLSLSGVAHAQQRPDHFQGKSAGTLTEAYANLAQHNKALAAILAKDKLEPADMAKVHELSYTLENALDKIRVELVEVAKTLERVHVGSEREDFDEVKTQGRKYLETAAQITR
ncbi:MAG TPA: DUF6746 family protein [Candidimonas sp.]|nr:DUF6746 family protein [Candidimonas sp.]